MPAREGGDDDGAGDWRDRHAVPRDILPAKQQQADVGPQVAPSLFFSVRFLLLGAETSALFCEVFAIASIVIAMMRFDRLFSKTKIKGRLPITLLKFFAPATLGIYLIHFHSSVREVIFDKKIGTWLHDMPGFAQLPMMLAVCAGIFLGCALVERFRMLVFGIRLSWNPRTVRT